MTLRNLLIAFALLVVAGCGCNDDSSVQSRSPQGNAAMVLGTVLNPIPVDPPQAAPFKIDVTFVLDDGDHMIEKVIGLLPSVPNDPRTRMQAAQAIFRNLQANILARFDAEWQAQNPGTTTPDLDLAFAVARYEDFGGSFATARGRDTGNVDDPANKNNDQDTRPFILNMPILRAAHPQFADLFANAISREAPGDGAPFSGIIRAVDAQSGIEALWQVAADTNPNTGAIGGFDGDGNGNTLGSGAPTSQEGARNPQTLPGATGDVPGVLFQPYPASTVTPMNSNLAGEDDDGEPLFQVADETGAAVTIPNPAGGTMPSPASGNIGQVGWRPDAARFVLLSSSVGTVTPTTNTLTGTPEPILPTPLPPPTAADKVASTAGGANAPREAREALIRAFDAGPVRSGNFMVAQRRTGNDLQVAPAGAHTLEETIARLNELNIEVLLLGAPIAGGLDTKPGVTGVNGDEYSNTVGGINGDLFDPNPANPDLVDPELAPWYWFNAVSQLTTPPVTSVAPVGRTVPPVFGGDATLFWGVYNMGTVWPIDPNSLVVDETLIRSTMADDLAERIVAWIDGGYITGGSTGVVRPTLPTAVYEVELTLQPGSNVDVVQTAPAPGGTPQTTFTVTVEVPAYYSDEAKPADVEVRFPAATSLQYITLAGTPLPADSVIPFDITSRYTMQNGADATNIVQQGQIEDQIKARGDGFTVDGMGNIIPLTNATDQIIQGQGSARLYLPDPLVDFAQATLQTFVRGGFFVRDVNPGSPGAGVDQVGGTLPFPANP